MKKSLWILLCGLASAQAFATPDVCDKQPTAYDRSFCSSKLLYQSDQDLNKQYQELRKLITPKAKEQLKQTQREWIAYRNDICFERRRTEDVLDTSCAADLNRARASYLQERVQECRAGMCDNEAIARESW